MSLTSHKKNINNFKNFRAFSLIELSLVILVIGVLIVGITASSILIKKSRITNAQRLSENSPIAGIRATSLWLETSLDSSFVSQIDDNSSIGSNSWNDRSSSKISLTIAGSGADVVYANTINYIPGIKFSNGKYLTFDGSFLNNTDYTISILEKRLATGTNYFLGDSSNSDANESILLGYSLDNQIVHSQGDSNSYNSSVSTYNQSKDYPRVFTFTHSTSDGNKTYINGYLAASDSNRTNHLTNISTIALGKGYQGEIGEIAIFTKKLKNSERKDVEEYLAKKFNANIDQGNSLGATTCDGIVTSSGCSQACSVSVPGVSTSSVADGASGTFSCSQTGYSGSIDYTCSNGTISTTGSCSCTSGYEFSGGSCVQAPCSISVTGSSTTSVTGASGSITCDSEGYTGSVTYTCSGGNAAAISGTCSCTSGYTLSDGECIKDPACSGGTITSVSGGVVHTFKSSGTLSCPEDVSVQYLIVAGGGGSGGFGGGGGAGGLLSGTTTISSGDYTITVGAGGSGETANNVGGTNGGNSSFNSLTAIGGGYGRHSLQGTSGGSGGGNGYDNSSDKANGTSGQGNAGGVSAGWISPGYPAGGGGGAGSAGGNASSANGGIGGDAGAGVQSSITGTAKWYGVGGPGASRNGNHGSAAAGGSSIATAGAANTGNGAGAGTTQWVGKSGGSGIVIIRY